MRSSALSRRTVHLLLAAVLLPATVLGPQATSGARAADLPIEIPLHTYDAPAKLLGVSEAGLAISQASTIQSGSWDGPLLPRRRTEVDTERTKGAALTGTTLAYTEFYLEKIKFGTTARRLDILTGEDVVDPPLLGSGLTFVGDGWVGLETPGYQGRPILRWPLSGGTSSVVWANDGKYLQSLTADAESLLVAYREYQPGDNPSEPTGPYALDLIDLDTGRTQQITRGPSSPESLTLAPDRIVWFTQAGSYLRTAWSIPRSGGTPVGVTEARQASERSEAQVTPDGTIGYLTGDSGSGHPMALRLLRNGRFTDIPVPARSSGLDTLGNDFYTAAAGPAEVAGVYRVRDGAAARVMPIPRPEREIPVWSYDHGVLRYADRTTMGNLSLWKRRIEDGDGDPVVSAESAVPLVPTSPFGSPPLPAMSFDAGRGAIPSRKFQMQWDLLDRERKTGVAIEQTWIRDERGQILDRPGKPVVSGAYVLLNGVVHRTDGELIHTEHVRARRAGQDSLFGSRLVYGLVTSTGKGEVWSVDTERPAPVRLASSTCTRAPENTVWGGLSAWTSCDAREISIGRVTGGGTPRTVSSGLAGEAADLGLTMNGSTLGWVADGAAYVLDLSSPTSSPVRLPGSTRRMDLDGRSAVREMNRETPFRPTFLQVEKLPFEVLSAPLLTSQVLVLGFTPDGDGKHDTWAPQFDAGSPLASASIRFTSVPSGKTARTLKTTQVSDGSIRDLIWDGRTGSGKKAPKGPYRWVLTARDASGALLTTNGRSPITGTVEIS